MVPQPPITPFQRLQPPPPSEVNPPPTGDPFHSPHPVPWNWIWQVQAELTAQQQSGLRYYRTPALVSPDGRHAAYSRIQMRGEPVPYRSRITSLLFLENLQAGELYRVRPASGLAENLSGLVSVLIPASWSARGDRLLCRQFEGFLSTSEATDCALVWERSTHTTTRLSPHCPQSTTAILLGWSRLDGDRVLFRAGTLGEENWQNWSVALNGQTTLAEGDHPITYGHPRTRSWTGIQAWN